MNKYFNEYIFVNIRNIPYTSMMRQHSLNCSQVLVLYVTGPAKIGHVGSQNLTTFQTFIFHNILFQYGMAIKISEFADNLFGFTTLLTESKY